MNWIRDEEMVLLFKRDDELRLADSFVGIVPRCVSVLVQRRALNDMPWPPTITSVEGLCGVSEYLFSTSC